MRDVSRNHDLGSSREANKNIVLVISVLRRLDKCCVAWTLPGIPSFFKAIQVHPRRNRCIRSG